MKPPHVYVASAWHLPCSSCLIATCSCDEVGIRSPSFTIVHLLFHVAQISVMVKVISSMASRLLRWGNGAHGVRRS